MFVRRFRIAFSISLLTATSALATNPAVTVAIDATANRHAIIPISTAWRLRRSRILPR